MDLRWTYPGDGRFIYRAPAFKTHVFGGSETRQYQQRASPSQLAPLKRLETQRAACGPEPCRRRRSFERPELPRQQVVRNRNRVARRRHHDGLSRGVLGLRVHMGRRIFSPWFQDAVVPRHALRSESVSMSEELSQTLRLAVLPAYETNAQADPNQVGRGDGWIRLGSRTPWFPVVHAHWNAWPHHPSSLEYETPGSAGCSRRQSKPPQTIVSMPTSMGICGTIATVDDHGLAYGVRSHSQGAT